MRKFRNIDEKLLEELRYLKRKTGIGEAAVLRSKRCNRPPGLNARVVRLWLDGTVCVAPSVQVDFVLSRWREIWRQGEYLVPITDEVLASLAAERNRSGVSPEGLLKAEGPPPHGLSAKTIRHWLSGSQSMARKAQLDWVLDRWRSQPAPVERARQRVDGVRRQPRPDRVTLNKETVDELRAFRDDSGKGPRAMLTWVAENGVEAPPDLSSSIIAQWLSGAVSTANAKHLAFARSAWLRILASEPRLVPLAGERRQALDRLYEEGLLPRAIFDGAKDVPEGLSRYLVSYWGSKRPERVREDHLNWVLTRGEIAATSPQRRVPIDAQTRDQLRNLKRLTGIGQSELLRHSSDKPEGLRPQIVSSWISGSVKTARRSHLEWVLAAWESASAEREGPLEAVRTSISEEMLTELRILHERTGVTPERLLHEAKECPVGLTPTIMRFWLSGRTGSAVRSHLDWVRAEWSKREQYDFVTLTQGDIERISDLLAATGMGPQAALRACPGRAPDGLTSAVIKSWLSRAVCLARREHFEFVLSALEALLETGRDRLELTDRHIAALETERTRTGVDVIDLIRGNGDLPDCPPPATVHAWLSGRIGSAGRSSYDLVLARWCELPDMRQPEATVLGTGRYQVRRGRIIQNDAIRERLRTLMDRARMSGTAMVRFAEQAGIEVPPGFTRTTVAPWLNGSVKAVRPDHLEFAISIWESVPAAHDKVVLTDAQLAALHEFRDVGVLIGPIFADLATVPEGLSAPMVGQWLSGHASTARKDHLDWVLARCAAVAASKTRRVPITDKVVAELGALRERTGVGQTELLRDANEVPEGLSAAMVTAWINRHVATARKDHLDYVIGKWKSVPRG